ncbi:MaoC family dehydratase N-terminal domain-containing protein [Frankia sp. CNm7]|uniref:MaoC family dehydratase N-terminal domain-containing protein n=1 Tax=Frankia nepalensis TaxID=1836974 RepID=A0A937RDX8_9ACTN|nr:MaoC family dehydratase N-terminal domain-containing protein [Frankia nepalensis]MBL7502372.1 MaoC family dehydratase N-terminal domain-containing protein [Frankia nepalensis]MBL7516248.1 MaoC family dehydratase N-terminal domain-containing protein [Frankia nepalensis]MBL7520118.1 MaoC family dehydratase N-terminal domain-containing protein [Frankia nepalensis]MBL7625674.1 MaoC family dehydratase N-terminal domain-containing protein [Frankia nepalensis]
MPGPGYTMEVELGKIREFARATKSRNPDHLAAERPVSPVTFLMTSAFWSDGALVPWEQIDGFDEIDPGRVLHGGQEFVFHGEPPRAGTRLVGQARIAADYVKEGRRGGTMRFVEIVQEFRTPDGRPVASARNTVIITGQAPENAADQAGGKDGAR